MDYFSFFDLPPHPSVDQAALKRKYLLNSRKYHPDFYTLASAEKQAEVLEMATLNNQAYKTLQDDDARLKYFLTITGALGEEGSNQVPQAFLMEVMDVNEVLMELEFDDNPALKTKAAQMVAQLASDLAAEVGPLLAQYDAEKADPAELNTLRDYYLKRRYLLRIREKI